MFIAIAGGPSFALDVAPVAGPAGPLNVQALLSTRETGAFSIQDLDWHDSARGRDVPVRLYMPDSAGLTRPVGLIVFSHGIGGSRQGYSYLGKFFAGHGYASLHLQHVGSDRSLWAGNPFALTGRLRDAAQESEALARVADLRFALDQVLGLPELRERIDRQRMVAAGHSYGANTTMLVAGARVERQGRSLDLQDPRIRAAIILSAPPFYGEGDTARILEGVKLPTLHITATEDVIRIPGYYSGAGDRVAIYESISGARKMLAVFEGGSHSIFTDRAGTGGVALNPQVKAATAELSLAFLGSIFDGDDRAINAWPQRHAAILARFAAR
jgi:predicted dienelactone hydrolase